MSFNKHTKPIKSSPLSLQNKQKAASFQRSIFSQFLGESIIKNSNSLSVIVSTHNDQDLKENKTEQSKEDYEEVPKCQDNENEEGEQGEQSEEDSRQVLPPRMLDKLAKFPMFKNAPSSFHNAIASRLSLVQYHSQEYIVKYGEPAKAMYWILRGSVAVTSPDGEAIFAELVTGQFFGEIGILFNRPRTATVIARTKVLLGVLTVDNFNAVLPDFPLVERMIRDEAQERLSIQDKRNRNDVINLLPSHNDLLKLSNHDDFMAATVASNVATAISTLPGPSIPPHIKSSSPLVASNEIFYNLQPNNFNTQDFNTSAHQLPQIHDNIDHSIPAKDFLKSLPMFMILPSHIIHELVLGVEPRRYEPFEYIVKKGDSGHDIFFIMNGEVEVLYPKKIQLVNTEGNKDKKLDHVIARLGPGQYFGEMAFLESISNENKKDIVRSADIRTITTVNVLVVSSDQLKNLYSRYPGICDEMKDTAIKRININKDSEKDYNELEESLFNKWMGFQPQKNNSLLNFTYSQSSSNENENENDPISKSSTCSLSNQSSTMASPISFQDSLSTQSSIHSSDDKSLFSRKRSISTINSLSPLEKSSSNPLILNLPPMNQPLPSINQFPSSKPVQSFQYMNYAKRLRLASISDRRPSSVLSTGLLDRALLRVFSLLTLPDLMKLRIICRRWRQLLYVAPELFEHLDLKKFNTSIDDKALIQITDFVGSRPKIIDISDCFHITDRGFSYMVNEIGMNGNITIIKMASVWDVSAMAIKDIAVPSIGQNIEELDFNNCRKVRDDVIERIIGWKTTGNKKKNDPTKQAVIHSFFDPLNEPIPGMEEFDSFYDDDVVDSSQLENQVGCKKIKKLNLGYCKHLTDRSMYHIALHANERLESLNLTRCTTITDAGFAYWAYQPFPCLRELKLSDCTFLSDKSIVAIASSAQGLEKLDLSFCCALTDVSVEVLCLGCPKLKHLDLSFCGSAVSDSTLLAISIHLRDLENLIIKGCVRFTRAGVDVLLSSSVPLKKLDISQCRNAHFYRDRIPAAPLTPVTPKSKSAFVTTSHDHIVEIII